MDRDRNLLFGILTSRLVKVDTVAFAEGARAWAKEPATSLPQRLVDSGAVSRQDARIVWSLVKQAVSSHGGDRAAALAAFGGEGEAARSFRGALTITASGEVEPSGGPVDLFAQRDGDAGCAFEEKGGRYRFLNEHSRGGMGRVLLVHDDRLGRDVAMKELLPETAGKETPGTPGHKSAAVVARFLREARVTGQLEHPSIVPVYELGRREDQTLYYTMKFVRGKTLDQALKDAGSLQERLGLLPHFVDLCQAIAYAHSRGVIHRDLKPANVMIGEFGETVVLDWGLAKRRGDEDAHEREMIRKLADASAGLDGEDAGTVHGKVIGTPTYMSPEQARGEEGLIDERSDIYALGAVLYELLTGHPPFQGENALQIRYQIIEKPPEAVRTAEPQVPPELVAICERAMRKNPADRYVSAKDLAEETERFQSGRLVRAYEYPFSEHLRRFIKKHAAVLTTAAAALAALIGIGVYSYIRVVHQREVAMTARNQAETEREKAVAAERTAVAAREEADRELYRTTISLAAQFAEQGELGRCSELLGACSEGLRHWEWGYLLSLCNPYAEKLDTQVEKVWKFRLSPDCRTLACTAPGYAIQLWDIPSRKRVRILEGHTGEAMPTAFSPDGVYLASASRDGSTRIWRVETGAPVSVIEGHASEYMAFSPDGSRIAMGEQGGILTILDVKTREVLFTEKADSRSISEVAFLSDGRYLIIGASGEGKVKILHSETGTELRTFETLEDRLVENPLTTFAVSPDEQYLATASRNYARPPTVRLWRLSTGEPLRSFRGHTYAVFGMAFSPDGTRLATASGDHTARIWEVATGREIRNLAAHKNGVGTVAFAEGGTRLIVAGDDPHIEIWDVGSNEGEDVSLNTGLVNCLCFSPDGKLLATGDGPWQLDEDGTIRLWDLATQKEVRAFKSGAGPVFSLEFSPDGRSLAAGCKHSAVKLWEVETGREIRTLRTRGDFVWSVTFDEKGTRLAAGMGGTAFLMVWDSAGKELFAVPSECPVESVDFSPNERLLATAHREDRAVRIWDANTGDPIHKLQGHEGWCQAVLFSPDGSCLASASRDATVKLWNPETGRLLHTLEGHTSEVYSLAFSPDGRRVFSGAERAVLIWDVASGRQLMRLTGTRPVALFPGDQTLATASYEGLVTLRRPFSWRMDDYPGDKSMAFEERVELYKQVFWEKHP